jgi:hypothetical protein
LEIVDKLLELAVVVASKFPLQLMRSPSVLQLLELSISTCRIETESNAVKFLAKVLTVEGVNLQDYQRQIMSIFGDQIIFNLIHAAMFAYPEKSSKMKYVCEVISVMKSASKEATMDILEKSICSMTNRNACGKVAISNKNLQDFFEAMSQ